MKEARDQPSILVVDDTRANIGFLLETLSQAGYRVRVAPDGETALEQIQYSLPDLVLLDVMMPGKNGLEVCSILRSQPAFAAVLIIFLTAMNDESAEIKGLESGADDYISKPVRLDELMRLLKKWAMQVRATG